MLMNTKSRKGVQSLAILLRQAFSRVNGVSTPIGGFSFQPRESERELAQKLMKFLNNKRILYDLMEYEVLDHVVLSVQDVRKRLGEYLEEVDSESAIGKNMNSMQAACRTFLTKMQKAVRFISI